MTQRGGRAAAGAGQCSDRRAGEGGGVMRSRLPMFAVHALEWTLPDPARVRRADPDQRQRAAVRRARARRVARLAGIGGRRATATAARVRGLTVVEDRRRQRRGHRRDAGRARLRARAALAGHERHAAGRRHRRRRDHGLCERAVPIERRALGALPDRVALLHSARAAKRLAGLVESAGLRAIGSRSAQSAPRSPPPPGPAGRESS